MKILMKSILNTVVTTALLIAPLADAAVYVKLQTLNGDVSTDANQGWFLADSFSFGVEREMKESGEKSTSSDTNVGIGELQECTISKSMDAASSLIAQLTAESRDAINSGYPTIPSTLLGDEQDLGEIQICIADEAPRGSEPVCYLKYKLDRAFIKSWSISGDADDRPTEEVAFYYNKISFGY